jgi:hypothetical protein
LERADYFFGDANREGRRGVLTPPRENALNLFEVIDVVARQHLHDALDGFLAALGMHAVMLPLLGREHFVESQIRFTQDAKLLYGFAGFALPPLFPYPGSSPFGEFGMILVLPGSRLSFEET